MNTCKVCNGSGETGTFGIFDCAAPGCNAAEERYALDMQLAGHEGKEGRLHEHDVRWLVYQWGKAAGMREALAELEARQKSSSSPNL